MGATFGGALTQVGMTILWWGNDREELRLLHRILNILNRVFAVTDFELFQRKGDFKTMITGVKVGATGTFQVGLVPPNGVPLASGPAVSVDDANVTLGPIDGNLVFTAS